MPTCSTVFCWLAKHPDFAEQYGYAMEQRAHAIFEEVLEIADNSSRDYRQTKNGNVPHVEHIQRTKLRMDARKWFIARYAPRKYGSAGGMTIPIPAAQSNR